MASLSGGRPGARAPPAAAARAAPFVPITDGVYASLAEVKEALRARGVESSNVIFAVDFTASNATSGAHSFDGRSLHDVTANASRTPYQEAMIALGEGLRSYDADGLIPAYGFGCSRTCDESVFSFMPADAPCVEMVGLQQRYVGLARAPGMHLAGPTSLAPAVHKACEIVLASGGPKRMGYHIVIIMCDGKITRPSALPPGELSEWEKETRDAFVYASNLPLSIIIVGVGDGDGADPVDPWREMRVLDDQLPERRFDNIQFVEHAAHRSDAAFCIAACAELAQQYHAITTLGLLSKSTARPPAPARPVLTLDPVATPVVPPLNQTPYIPPPPRHLQPPHVEVSCQICLEPPAPGTTLVAGVCPTDPTHTVCQLCLLKHLRATLPAPICPGHGCRTAVPQPIVRAMITWSRLPGRPGPPAIGEFRPISSVAEDGYNTALTEGALEDAIACMCGQRIVKSEGCNHITHRDCPYAQAQGRPRVVRGGQPPSFITDFCYLCRTELDVSSYPYKERALPQVQHYPDGPFRPCRRV